MFCTQKWLARLTTQRAPERTKGKEHAKQSQLCREAERNKCEPTATDLPYVVEILESEVRPVAKFSVADSCPVDHVQFHAIQMAKTTNADKVISNVYMTFRNYNFGADGRYNSEEHNKKQMQMIY